MLPFLHRLFGVVGFGVFGVFGGSRGKALMDGRFSDDFSSDLVIWGKTFESNPELQNVTDIMDIISVVFRKIWEHSV